jgi:hypothetical protein
MIPLLYFDASPSMDVVSYEADVWERHMVEAACPPGYIPPCLVATAPEPVSWAIVPQGDGRYAIYAQDAPVIMICLRAVDGAGNRSVCADDFRK